MMDWPWSKSEVAQVAPKSESDSSPGRYDGKPLLRLLELYVIWTLDLLTDEEGAALQAMAPYLTDLYGGDGTWQDALATTMHMPGNMPELIREVWAENREIAAANSLILRPEDFAEMFVDSNLS